MSPHSHHVSAAYAEGHATELRREARARQRARVVASLLAVEAPHKPKYGRWTEPFPTFRP